MEEAFGKYHPIINFIFFIGAIIFGMFFVHPVFLILSVLMSSLYYFLLKGKAGIRFFLGMLVLFAAISILNPFFNPYGETVLFTYFNERTFTLEAVWYGIATGCMFLSIILWFACYNAIMTSDKFIYLFGAFIPAISLVLSMALRFVPNLKKKAETILNARKCVGKTAGAELKKEKMKESMTVLSVLTSCALEGAGVTADSMKSRGYGCGHRSNFSSYRFGATDKALICFMLACIGIIIASVTTGGTMAEYIPRIQFAGYEIKMIVGAIAYGAFLAIPIATHIWGEASWRILRSKI